MHKPKNKKDIILIFPDPKLEGLTWHRMPFSVLAISSPLVKKGYNIRMFDERFERNLDENILSSLPNALCVGFSAFTGNQISGALRIAKIIKKNFPRIPLVWGGWHPSIFPEQTARDSNVDIVVYGQGENTFFDLVEALSNNTPVEGIPGLWYKKDGKIVKTRPRELEDINNFPPMPLDLINVQNYIGPHSGLENAMTLSYMSSQGCPFRCGFCADKRVYKRRWFGLKPQRVIEEISELVEKYSLEAIYFEDNNFFVDKNRVAEICKGIIANRLNIRWEAMGHPRQLARFDDEYWKLLRESGCRRILIGAESGDQKVLDLIKKDASVEDAIEFARKANRHKITPILSTVVGFPGSAKRDFFKTINLMVGIKRLYRETEWKLFLYTPYPGTDLYDTAIKYGMKEPASFPEWAGHTLRDVKTPWISGRFRSNVRDIAFFYFHVAYPSEYIQRKIDKVIKNNFMANLILKITRYIARVRLALNFYAFAFEPAMYNFFKRGKK